MVVTLRAGWTVPCERLAVSTITEAVDVVRHLRKLAVAHASAKPTQPTYLFLPHARPGAPQVITQKRSPWHGSEVRELAAAWWSPL